MDFSVDIIPTLGPAKDYIVAFGHLKLIRDRSNNDKNKQVPRDITKSTGSRLSKNILHHTHTSSSKKINQKLSGQTNISGDTAGTSNQTNSKIKLERSGEEKSKPSLIPRRKSNLKETSSREPSASIKSLPDKIKPNIQQRNIQRVQLLNINQEFFRENRSPPKSVTSARPIPTLGHIYRQDLSNDTFTDWFLESVNELRESYGNSIETTSTATNCSATCISVNNNEINKLKTTEITNLPSMENCPLPLKIFKTTNENVSEWLSSELDHPTRDNESGYRSTSPMSKISMHTAFKPGPFGTNIQNEKDTILQNTAKKINSPNIPAKNNVTDLFLSIAPTVIIKKNKSIDSSGTVFAIPKVNTDVKQPDCCPDFHKPLKYHSTPFPPRKKETIDKYPAASYVEYPSEVLQKTTNFETDGFDHLSSVIETGLGNLSSQWALKHNMNSNPTFNGMNWSKLHSSQGTFKKISTGGSWRSNGFDDKHGTLTSEKYSYHDYCYHYCWRKEVAKKGLEEQSLWDHRGRCKRCHKYRRSPCRNKLGQPLSYLRKRMTIGVCRHRLNRVWKKTTEKWANWSKSPSKLRRFRMMNYLQKSILWGNANVQTTIFVYHETGTDAVAREQKSAEITASLKLNSNSFQNDTSPISDGHVRAKTKHANIGPSMFPFLRYSSNNTLIHSRTSNQSDRSSGHDLSNIGAWIKEIKSINTQCSVTQKKNIIEGVLETSSVQRNVARKMTDFSSMNLKHAVSQDAYTQVVVMCNNADTTNVFTPTVMDHPGKSQSFCQDLVDYGVDAETDPIIDNKISQRSMNVMTSKHLLQELIHIETQVSPSVTLRNISTGILAKEMSQDTKSSIITDTTVPCRGFDNTVVTTKGTILSCTGTKITSVSSANIQTTSTISRMLKPFTVNTAVSTFVNTKHTDGSTTPLLCLPELEDVSLGTEAEEIMKTEKSTSQVHLENYLDFGVSPSGVVKITSRNCGSHQSQCSFGASIQPKYSTADMNTDVEPAAECPSMLCSDQTTGNSTVFDNCQTQYSSYYKDANGYWSSERCAHMRIGRSQLLSVRPLLPDAKDSVTQTHPSSHSAETITTLNQKVSVSVLTSQCAFEDRQQPTNDTVDEEHVLTLNKAHVGSDNETRAEPCRDNVPPVVSRVSCTTCQQSKQPSDCNKPRLQAKSRSANMVISSHLNANKWINECAKENKNVDSILTASAIAVSESLERATLVARSADKLTAPEIHQLSKVLLNSHPSVNCETAKSYGKVTGASFVNVSLKENNANQSVIKNKSRTLTADKVTSDEVVVKNFKESILQVRPNLCDIAPATSIPCSTKSSSKFSVVLKLDRICNTTDCDVLDHKSASVLTSRHILPRYGYCGAKEDERSAIDCLFVYDRPRCVIHSCVVDVAIQIQPLQKEKIHTKTLSSHRSIGIVTSQPCQVSYHQTSEVISEGLSQRTFKAIYDTTKFATKETSDSRFSRQSSSESTSDKTENEEPNKVTAQMTSCLDIEPAQCCCMRCFQIANAYNRSIQAVKDTCLCCPNCSGKITELQKIETDKIEDCRRFHLETPCHYYSNLLTMKLGRFRENFIRHLMPSVGESIYPLTENNFFAEACTMKPSGKQDEHCEAKISTHTYNNSGSSCTLSPSMSATDLRGHDKQDLKAVYCILSAIEGRVRRLKSNLAR